jgi:hypothetical protein
MICSSLVKSYILKSLMYFLIMFNEELIPFQKKKRGHFYGKKMLPF